MSLTIQWATESEAVEDGEAVVSSAFHVLEFDAVTEETHDAQAEVTQHAVEDGEAITDHKRAKPRTISIVAIVSQTPISAPPLSGFSSASVVATTRTGAADATVLQFASEFDRIADVAETLERLRAEPIDLTVTTRLGTYERVQLTRVNIPRKGPADSIEVHLELQEVFRVETQTVDAPVPREPRGQRRTEDSNETEGEEDEVVRSELRQITEWAGGLF